MTAAAVQGDQVPSCGEKHSGNLRLCRSWNIISLVPRAAGRSSRAHVRTLGMLGSSLPTAPRGSTRVLFLTAWNKSQLHQRAVGDKVTSHLDTVRGTSTILRAGEAPIPEQCFCELPETSKTTSGTAAASSAICWLRLCCLQTTSDVGTMPRQEALSFHGCQKTRPIQQMKWFSSLRMLNPQFSGKLCWNC